MREIDYTDDDFEPEYIDEDMLHKPLGKRSSRKAQRMMSARRAIEDHFEKKRLQQNVDDVWLDEDV